MAIIALFLIYLWPLLILPVISIVFCLRVRKPFFQKFLWFLPVIFVSAFITYSLAYYTFSQIQSIDYGIPHEPIAPQLSDYIAALPLSLTVLFLIGILFLYSAELAYMVSLKFTHKK